MWRIVAVGNLRRSNDPLILIVQGHVDFVVGALLPIVRARRPRCGALIVRAWVANFRFDRNDQLSRSAWNWAAAVRARPRQKETSR